MNRRNLLGLGLLGTVAVAAPVVAAACAVMPRRIQDQVIDGALHVENCHGMVISNCIFEVSEPVKNGIYFGGNTQQSLIQGSNFFV